MPTTLTSDLMRESAEKPVVLDLDSVAPPRRDRATYPVEVAFEPAPATETKLNDKPVAPARPEQPATPEPIVTPVAKTAGQKRAAARKASSAPKNVKPVPFTLKESIPVRVPKDNEVYSIWNCAESPDESIRVSDERVLRFRRGTLKCPTSGDDEAVALANQFAGGRYIRAEEKYLNDPIISRLTDPPTHWHSQEALDRHTDQYKRDHA